MAKRTKIHVVNQDDSWKVKKEGSQRSSSVHDTKQAAEQAAREQAKKEPLSQVIIHKKDGTIQEEHTYGNDPHPPDG
jgi:hypothetical protein